MRQVQPLGAPFHRLCMRVGGVDGGPYDVAVAPQPGLFRLLARRPDVAASVVVVGEDAFARWAELSVPPHLSARGLKPTAGSFAALGILVATAPLSFALAASLRLLALAETLRAPVRDALRWPLRDDELPTYTVLVPLYREERVVPDLARALRALDYPSEKLEVLVLLEEGDDATLAAARRHLVGRPFRVMVVQDGSPRTKPRACNFGLANATGEVVVIYDGEDRPEPDQLRRAAEPLAADPRLGVVQCRLSCDHAEGSPLISKLWSLDYDVLFAAVLPALSRLGVPFLLGGTSNHFRRTALTEVGGWDAHNVTEDADLSVRLAHAGWRSAAVDSATHEEAPVTVGAWLRQRSRWLKGFLVTTAVHARHPRGLRPRDLVALFAQLPAGLLSVAAYPLSLLLVVFGAVDPWSPLAWLMCAGQIGSLALAVRVASWRRRSPGVRPWLVLMLPVYWLLLAAALALALWEMVHGRASMWRKTEHGRARRPPVTGGGSRDPASTT